MGFRSGAYATVWEVTPVSQVNTKGRISISRKNKDTGGYETDFNGFVNFLGSSAAGKAMKLKPKDRIQLGDIDVRSKRDNEKNVTYYNFTIFSFEQVAPLSAHQTAGAGNLSWTTSSASQTQGVNPYDGDISEDDMNDLPF